MKLLPYKLVHVDKANECCEKVKALEADIENASDFIKDIEEGNLDSELKGNENAEDGNVSTLALSLLSMRTQMKMIAEQERERNWATEGLAKFVEILRSDNESLKSLSEKILSNLVKYMGANQGYLFILNDSQADNIHLELEACFAYNKKKYVEKIIQPGEGLIGQCYLEKDTIYLTDIPEEYVKITSGVGESLPRNVVMVPLKINDVVFGIVEMASFNAIKNYQIDFLEKLGESIASTIANVKVNDRTKKLLGDAQQMAEQLRSQEEEMRQNMEELSATQEELLRKQGEVSNVLEKFELVTKTTTEGLWDMLIPKNSDINDNTPFNWSDRFRHMLGYKNEKDFPNVLHAWSDLLHPDHKQDVLNAFSAHLLDLSGKTPYDVEYQLKLRDGSYRWFRAVGNSSRDENGNALRVAGSLIDMQAIKDILALQTQLEEKVKDRTAAMEAVMKEAESKEDYLNKMINATKDSILTVDLNYNIVYCNNTVTETNDSQGIKMGKGLNVLSIYPTEDQKALNKSYYDRAFKGETFNVEESYMEQVYTSNYTPIRNSEGKVIGAAIFAKDISEIAKSKKEVEKLLAASQQQAEELKAQEEELRQNMEELSSTQEDMQRVLIEVQDKEQYLNELINVSTDTICTIDKEYKLLSFNKTFTKTVEGFGMAIESGFDMMQFYPTEELKQKQRELYNRVFKGEKIELTDEYNNNGDMSYYLTSYAPLYNANKEIFGAASFSKDISEMVKAKMQTEKLLAASQQQSEELKAQEEELRQNMEELASTQEDMQRVLREVQGKEQYLNELINVPKDSIYTLDSDYKLLSFNKSFSKGIEAMGIPVNKGFDMMQLFPDEKQKQMQRNLYDKAFKGENFEQIDEYDLNGEISYFASNYAPLYNENKQIFAVAGYSKDVTEMMRAKKQTEKLLAESQQQSEELKAQEEELRQNMEELASTQEDMQRVFRDVQDKEQFLNELINVSNDSISTLDRNYKLLSFNKRYSDIIGAFGVTAVNGLDTLQFYPTAELKQKQKDLFDRVFRGEIFEHVDGYDHEGGTMYFLSTYAPLYDVNKNVFAAALYSKDITELTLAQKKSEKLLAESQQQSEELRAQEEELRQNMEELQATQEAMSRKQEEVEAARSENERLRQAEAERAVKVAEMQKEAVNKLVLRLKEVETELKSYKQAQSTKTKKNHEALALV